MFKHWWPRLGLGFGRGLHLRVADGALEAQRRGVTWVSPSPGSTLATFSVALVLCLLPFPASAASAVVDLCRATNVIIVGSAQQRSSHLGQDEWGDETIFTDVDVRIERVVLGPPLLSLALTIEGGVVGDRGLWVPEYPRMEIGDRYILFLRDRGIDTGPAFLFHLYLPASIELPHETDAKNTWNNLCASHPEGISQDILLAPPQELLEQGWSLLAPPPALTDPTQEAAHPPNP